MNKSIEKTKFETVFIDKLEPYNVLMPQIIETAKEIKENCTDYILEDVPAANIEVDDHDNITFSNLFNNEMTFKTTNTSMRQLCNKLDIPYRSFYQKIRGSAYCQKEKLALTKQVLEELASYYPYGLLIRTYKDTIRAVLSKQYSIYDSDQITKTIDDCFFFNTNIDEFSIAGYINTPEQLQIRFINNNPILCDETEIYSGISISSSDIGENKLSVSFYIYEDKDKNGICINVRPGTEDNLYNQKHLGIKSEQIKYKIIEALDEFPKLSENIKEYIKFATYTSLKQSGLYNPKSYNSRIMFRELNLVNKEIDDFMEILQKSPKTLWGYINAITDYARTLSDINKRTHLENIAGRILLRPQKYGIKKEEDYAGN